ncbi:MAG: hypothetical protein ACOX5R_08450 [bacterium]|jgi:hypothetical protein
MFNYEWLVVLMIVALMIWYFMAPGQGRNTFLKGKWKRLKDAIRYGWWKK